MKKLMLFTVIVLSATITTFATIRTVDNTPGSAAQYTGIQAAVDAATTGDTILVYGSAYTYGTVSISKKLTFVGSAGFDPEVSNESRPTVSYFSFAAHTTTNGTVITGFNVGYVTNSGYNVDNVGVYNNYFNAATYSIYFYYGACSNWVIEGNVFQNPAGMYVFWNYANTASLNNILVKNNYVEQLSYYYSIFESLNSAWTFRNNVFIIRSNFGYYPFSASSNVLLENNIFWVVESGASYPLLLDITAQQCAGCVFNNNIIYNAGGGTMTAINSIGNGVSGSNNIMNQDPQFTSFTASNNYTITENYNLGALSPGNNAGTDGTDIGLYGANYNWENRKYPKAFPHQEIFNVINSSVPQGTPVNVQLKARKATN